MLRLRVRPQHARPSIGRTSSTAPIRSSSAASSSPAICSSRPSRSMCWRPRGSSSRSTTGSITSASTWRGQARTSCCRAADCRALAQPQGPGPRAGHAHRRQQGDGLQRRRVSDFRQYRHALVGRLGSVRRGREEGRGAARGCPYPPRKRLPAGRPQRPQRHRLQRKLVAGAQRHAHAVCARAQRRLQGVADRLPRLERTSACIRPPA